MGWIIPVITAAAGVYQAVSGAQREKKATKALEKAANAYQPNQSIMDYYSKALQRYNANPYKSAGYRYATESAGKGLAQGLSYLQDRRSALAGVGTLVQGYNDATQRAAAGAEQMQAQELSQLGGAAGMKTQEDRYPFELRYNLLGMKAAGGAQIMNAGLQNIYSGLNAYSQNQMIRSAYGNYGGGYSYSEPPRTRPNLNYRGG